MRKYTIMVISIVLGALTIVAGLNIAFDTSGLFNTDFSKSRVEPNQHFVKMRYIIDNTEKYNAFQFGSSRVGKIHLENIGDGYKYYNMTYSEGIPKEWLEDVKLMIKHDVKIKRIMIGVDDFSFRVIPEVHKNQKLRIPYQENNITTYLGYMLEKPKKDMFISEYADRYAVYDIYDSGCTLTPAKVEDEIEANVASHSNDNKFHNPSHYEGERIKETIEELSELNDICKKNDIELIAFINPIHQTTYLDTNFEEFIKFKRELVNIMEYYDFSGLNDITTNNYYYYETSHYRPIVGDMIIDRIFKQSKEKNTNFGKYITKNNIDEHIQYLRENIKMN